MRIEKKIYFIVSVLVVAISFSFCARRVAPAIITGRQGKTYDAATFNYVYVEAVKQKLMGNNADALDYFERCIKINPESDASYYQMAQILLSSGDFQNGKRYAAKAQSIDPENIWYLMMLAGIYYQQHNIDSAIVYYEEAVRNFPDKEDLQLALGSLYSEKGNFESANSIFSSLDERYGVNESSTVAMVRNLMLEEKYDEALLKAELLVEKYPEEIVYNGLLAEIYRGQGESQKAMEVYNRLVERNPGDPQTQLSLCEFLISEKSYDELFMLLNTVILNSRVTREDKISLFARLIENADIVSDHSNQMKITLMVLEANYPEDAIIPLLKPDLLIRQDYLVEAAIQLEEIVKKTPDNYYGWEKLLFVYLQLQDYNKLMIRGEECATRFNRSFVAKILYANGALEVGKYVVALDELRKAEILAGDNKELITQVLTMRADVYYRMNNYTEAFKIFDEALKANNDDLTIMNNYAYYLAEQNMNLKEAEIMAKKVIDIEKENATFLDTYAWVLYKRGKLKEASRLMESIISNGDKTSAEWYEHYGFILRDQRKCEKAIENWDIAISIDSTKTNLIKEIENCKR